MKHRRRAPSGGPEDLTEQMAPWRTGRISLSEAGEDRTGEVGTGDILKVEWTGFADRSNMAVRVKDNTKISGFSNCGAIGFTSLLLRDLGWDIDLESLVSSL